MSFNASSPTQSGNTSALPSKIINFLSPREGSNQRTHNVVIPIFEKYTFWNNLSKISLCFLIGSFIAEAIGIHIPLLYKIASFVLLIFGLNRGKTSSPEAILDYLELNKSNPLFHAFLSTFLSGAKVKNIEFNMEKKPLPNIPHLKGNSFELELEPIDSRDRIRYTLMHKGFVVKNSHQLIITFNDPFELEHSPMGTNGTNKIQIQELILTPNKIEVCYDGVPTSYKIKNFFSTLEKFLTSPSQNSPMEGEEEEKSPEELS